MASSPSQTNFSPPSHPLELRVKVALFRFLAHLASVLERYFSRPIPPGPSFQITIPSTLSNQPGKIPLLFYTPPSYKRPSRSATNSKPGQKKYPVVVVFHGGGYTLGSAKDDARWMHEIVTRLSAVCVSVDYRLAPEHPFPTPVDDSADALAYLFSHADEFALDISRTIVSGFSAGGTLSLASILRLHNAVTEGALPPETKKQGRIVGVVPFYPGLDWTHSRDARTASNPISGEKSPIPKVAFDMFDRGYLALKPDMRSPYLSPGLADTKLLREALPPRIFLVTCEWDQLLVEGETFRKRLREEVAVVNGEEALGIEESETSKRRSSQQVGVVVSGTTVEKVAHAWDKAPSLWRGNATRDKVYAEAMEEMKRMLEDERTEEVQGKTTA